MRTKKKVQQRPQRQTVYLGLIGSFEVFDLLQNYPAETGLNARFSNVIHDGCFILIVEPFHAQTDSLSGRIYFQHPDFYVLIYRNHICGLLNEPIGQLRNVN